jgi:integrase
MAWTTVEGWSHGRVWVDAKGRRTFYIRKRRGAKAFNVSTRCSTLRGALAELERWERDPDAYRPSGSEDRLLLTDALIERYGYWTEGSSTDTGWREAKRRYLEWWRDRLSGRDLRTIKLDAIHEALAGASDVAKRTVVLKHLFSYLRQTGQIHASDDPTLGALPVPQGRPAQDVNGSKVIEEEEFRKVLPLLAAHYADACRMQAATGCHVTEVVRFATTGAVLDAPEGADGAAVLAFQHKGGHVHRVLVGQPVADAARRIRGRKPINRNAFYRAVKAACIEAKVDPWTPGRFRATFATRAVEQGVAPAAVALALGHKSQVTTLGWYATLALPPRVRGME